MIARIIYKLIQDNTIRLLFKLNLCISFMIFDNAMKRIEGNDFEFNGFKK